MHIAAADIHAAHFNTTLGAHLWPLREIATLKDQWIAAGEKTDSELMRTRNALANRFSYLAAAIEPDVVHTHNSHRRGGVVLHALLSTKSRFGIVNTCHTDRPSEFAAIRLAESLGVVNVLVGPVAESEVANVRLSRTRTLAIKLDEFRPPLSIDDGDKRVLGLGAQILLDPLPRFQYRKDPLTSIAVFELLKPYKPDLKLIICNSAEFGQKWHDEIDYGKEVEQSHLTSPYSEDIHIVHGQSTDMASIYRATAISKGAVIRPSRVEPLGLVLLEAMACGVPVVATDVGGQREALGRAGLLAKRIGNFENQLAAQALLTLDSPRTRQRMIEDGLRRVQSWSTTAASTRLEDVYLAAIELNGTNTLTAEVSIS